MIPGLFDVVMGLGGLIVPPVYDLIKRKFTKPSDLKVEETLNTLATTKPEALAGYAESYVKIIEADVKNFNRDVTGTISTWVCNLRAAIRPIAVIASFVILAGMILAYIIGVEGPAVGSEEAAIFMGVRGSCEATISSWMGHRFTIKG